MLVKIKKAYKKMKVGDTPNVDNAYGAILIKKGIADKVPEKKSK